MYKLRRSWFYFATPFLLALTNVVTLQAAVRYVDLNSANPTPPYTTWATAAAAIQDAVDAASPNDEIIVTNGTYSTGGRALTGTMTNRVSITNAVFLHSVNGPQATIIQGYQLPGATNGDGAVRCVLLAGPASLAGFTLTQGATRSSGDYTFERSGGGMWLSGGTVSNCLIIGNAASGSGGGVYQGGSQGLLNNCVVGNNFCSSMTSSNLGGGGAWCTLNNCTVTNNQAPLGGGAGVCLATNCTISRNSATNGGGAYYGTLANCTLSGNMAGSGGGTYNANVYNSLLTGNSATNGGGAYGGGFAGSTVTGNYATNGGGAYNTYVFKSTLSTNWAPNGGGAYQAYLESSFLIGNVATANGGGMYGGNANNCVLWGNGGTNGGGTYTGTLTNCTLVGNVAASGGGGNAAVLQDCISYFNQAGVGINYLNGDLEYCCTTPLPPSGAGNITPDPLFTNAAAGNFRLLTNSPCINAGDNVYVRGGLDMDGNPRVVGGTVDMGPYEAQFQPPVRPSIVSQPQDQTVTEGSNATFSVAASGTAPLSYQWNENGSILLAATNSSYTVTNAQLGQSGNYYSVTITNAIGSTNSTNAYLTVNPAPVHGTHYVDAASAHPVQPYTSWATAASTIQDAIDAALAGDEIVVTNGVYAGGGKAVFGAMTNRAAVDKPLFVHSVNGALVTIIQGQWIPGTTNGDGAIRCVYLTNGATLSGFTVTNGATRDLNGDYSRERSGGGIWCELAAPPPLILDCVIVGNSAAFDGGGVYGGTLSNCVVSGNSAQSGGGEAYSALNNSLVIGNVAASGAADFEGTLNNCLVTSNTAGPYGGYYGGITYGSTLNNCTVARNSGVAALSYYSGHSGVSTTLNNCIVVDNDGGNYTSGCIFSYSCTTPDPGYGTGNIFVPPLFVDEAGGNFRLQQGSPCIDTGSDALSVGSTDLDGNPRVVNGTVDMGAYEFQAGAGARPALTIAQAAQDITLAWPLWASNFILEEAASLATPWSTNHSTPTVSSNEDILTLSPDSAAKFYRLNKPQ
jgi:hypothetical protein